MSGFKAGEWPMRNGELARIYEIDAGGDWPILGSVPNTYGGREVRHWLFDGRYGPAGVEHPLDLIPLVPPLTADDISDEVYLAFWSKCGPFYREQEQTRERLAAAINAWREEQR